MIDNESHTHTLIAWRPLRMKHPASAKGKGNIGTANSFFMTWALVYRAADSAASVKGTPSATRVRAEGGKEDQTGYLLSTTLPRFPNESRTRVESWAAWQEIRDAPVELTILLQLNSLSLLLENTESSLQNKFVILDRSEAQWRDLRFSTRKSPGGSTPGPFVIQSSCTQDLSTEFSTRTG